MNASETRALAREKLAGKWKKAVIATLVFVLIEGIISSITNHFEKDSFMNLVLSIISIIITVPMSFGFLMTMFKLNDDEEISYTGFLSDGFSNFGKAWGVALQTLLKLIVPLILFIGSIILFAGSTTASVAGGGNGFLAVLSFILYIAALVYFIYKSLSYTFGLSVLIDNPDMTAIEAVEKSAELMQGNIWAYICLKLSFIGWAILSIFTLCIGLLWLIPYTQIAEINFYRNLINK